MYQTLYRKWRPKTFDDVCGQEHITSILRYEVKEDRISHAYLFCGSRGTGKTTCAKLLARAVNCEHPQNGNPCGVCDACRGIESGRITDVIEMDAASNNGVDNIRDIRDDVVYAPTECRKRVFIIDEVHMLSVSAFNALLKTLEEPPEHIVFILATTEMHKIPATILSRCQRFDFRRIGTGVIADRLRVIADAESIPIDDDALHLIAHTANGGMRDAIGMLELCAGGAADGETLTAEKAAALIGTTPVETAAAAVEAIQRHDIGTLLTTVDTLYRESRDIGVFWQSLLSFYRDMLVVRTVREPEPFLDLTEKQLALPKRCAAGFTTEMLLHHIRVLDEVFSALQRGAAPARITVEMALIRLCDTSLSSDTEALLARIAALEDRLARGAAPDLSADIPFASSDVRTAVSQNAEEKRSPSESPVPAEIPVPPAKTQRSSGENPPPASVRDTAAETGTSLGNKPVLRPFRGWQDAVQRLENSQPQLIAFLRNCKVCTCDTDEKLHLFAPDSFTAKMILTNKDVMQALTDAVNVVSQGKKYRTDELSVELADKVRTDGYEWMDALAEEADGNAPAEPQGTR